MGLPRRREPRAPNCHLRKEGYGAEHVQNALEKGAQDAPDVLPYAVENDLVLVTADVKDFAPLSDADHEGLMLLDSQRKSAYEIANAVLDIVEAYGSRESFTKQKLDSWM